MRLFFAGIALVSVVAVAVACGSSTPAMPAYTVNCPGAGPPTEVAPDSGSSCAGICLAIENACTSVDLGDASDQVCPTGYEFASNRYSCASGASCCVSIAAEGGAEAGAEGGDAAAAEDAQGASPDGAADAPTDAVHD